MNIALINTYAHGGAGTAAIRTTEALNSIGHEAQLLVREGKSSETVQVIDNQWFARLPFYAERVAFLPFERDKSVRFSFSPANFGLNLSQYPLVKKADAIHLHWINQGFLGLKNIGQLLKLNKPIVWTLHDMWAFTGGCHYSQACDHYKTGCGNCFYLKKPFDKDLTYRVLQNKQSFFTDKIRFTTPSEWLAKIAQSSSLLKNAQISAIPNPINIDFFKPFSKEERAFERQKLGIPADRNVLLFVAMNIAEERKGFAFLKTGLEKLHAQHPDFQADILVLGKCDPKVLAELPFPTKPLGLVSDPAEMRKFYALADVFIIPSLEDNLPNTVMESLACGTPVVGFETGGISEMVGHLENGFIAKQRDSGALADGIYLLLNNKEKLFKMRESARKKVVDNYSFSVVAKQYERLYL